MFLGPACASAGRHLTEQAEWMDGSFCFTKRLIYAGGWRKRAVRPGLLAMRPLNTKSATVQQLRDSGLRLNGSGACGCICENMERGGNGRRCSSCNSWPQNCASPVVSAPTTVRVSPLSCAYCVGYRGAAAQYLKAQFSQILCR